MSERERERVNARSSTSVSPSLPAQVTVEVRAPASGTLTAILAQKEDTLIVGEDLLEIDVGVGSKGTAVSAPPAAPPAERAGAPASAAATPTIERTASGVRVHPSGKPSLIRFRSGGPEASAALSPAVPATAAVGKSAAAQKAPAAKASPLAHVGVRVDWEPPRLQMSSEEMECVDSGGASSVC